MKPIAFLPFILIQMVAWSICDAEDTELRLTSTTPDVHITQRSNDRKAIVLPDLQYEIRVEAVCAAGFLPESIMLSVADTRKRVAAADLDSRPDASISLRIPAKQIPPLSVAEFCLESDEGGEQNGLTVRGVLSAQVSLLCTADIERKITYASHSLDINLACGPSSSE